MKKLTNRIRVFRVTADGRCLLTYIPWHIQCVRNLIGGPLDTINLFNRCMYLTTYIHRMDKTSKLEPNKLINGVYGDVVICAGLNGVLKDLSDEQYKFLINVFCKKKEGANVG